MLAVQLISMCYTYVPLQCYSAVVVIVVAFVVFIVLQIYKQAGNSIAVPIFESMFRKIILHETA